ncbi:MAG: Acyl carrier protein [Pseudomonas citronellolis]|nr:MAG: Acyl carrier protein [Pseudomonas citronellolis]
MIDLNAIGQAMQAAGIDLPLASIDPDQTLASQGLDSLDSFNILLELQEMTGISVGDDQVEGLNTLNNIVAFFNAA